MDLGILRVDGDLQHFVELHLHGVNVVVNAACSSGKTAGYVAAVVARHQPGDIHIIVVPLVTLAQATLRNVRSAGLAAFLYVGNQDLDLGPDGLERRVAEEAGRGRRLSSRALAPAGGGVPPPGQLQVAWASGSE